jgi:mannose-6-phosphate isomerase-like protein (cupin superfamily)
MPPFTIKQIDELCSINHGAVKLAGDELGVQSFGLQVLDLPADLDDYPEHDHADDGQEEVYAVLSGSVHLSAAGETIEATAGSLVFVAPTVARKLVPGANGARILAIGCATGGYQRPVAFRVGQAT